MDLLVHGRDDHATTADHRDRCGEQDLILAEIWILGDRYLIRPLQNYVMAQMHSIQTTCGKMDPTVGRVIYDNTAVGSPLRRFAVDQICWLRGPVEMKVLDVIPTRMLKDITLVLAEEAPADLRRKRAKAMTASDYYVTEDGSVQLPGTAGNFF
jgi:hypothetical protein